MSEISTRKQLLSLLLGKVEEIVQGPGERGEKLSFICSLLKDNIPHYDWVGIYFKGARELVLGPFAGEPTEHERIPFGKGICGQAAQRRTTLVVPDVARETDYLSCSPQVQSEIVIPLFKAGEFVGELDIDSHTLSAFASEDREFLEEAAKILSQLV